MTDVILLEYLFKNRGYYKTSILVEQKITYFIAQ